MHRWMSRKYTESGKLVDESRTKGSAISRAFSLEDIMATIKKIIGKKGNLSYKITVSSGIDCRGKQVRHYTTYTPPQNMKEARADKEAAKEALLFEEKITQGYRVDNRLSFEEYAQQFLATKKREGIKKTTYDRYVLLLRRINPAIGHLKLQDIRPQMLNEFYENLMEEDIRLQPPSAQPKKDITKILKEKKLSQDALSRKSGVAASTIQKARTGGTIRWDRAEAIATALEIPTETLFLKDKHREPLSNKSVLEHHRVIRTILGQAEKELIVPYNAASKATPPKVHRAEVNTLEPDEIGKILDALGEEPLKWQCIIHLMIVTGCRRGEIMGLKWDQIDLDKHVVHICETLLATDTGIHKETPKTPESRRYINIPNETVELLKKYHTEQDRNRTVVGDQWQETGYVFTREIGLPMHPDSVNNWLNVFCERHGLRHINPHAFRHSMASILINNGTDILAVSRRLGHTNASTTLNFYGHILQQADAKSSECIADVLLRDRNQEKK